MAAERGGHVASGFDTKRLGGDSEQMTETPSQELHPPPIAEKRRTRNRVSASPIQSAAAGRLITPSDKFPKGVPKAQKAAQGSPQVVEAIPIKNGAAAKRPKSKTTTVTPDPARKTTKADGKRKRPDQVPENMEPE